MAGTIVYVDQEPDLPAGLGRELARLGFRLRHAASVDDAWTLVRNGTARLLILEVLLDGDRGWRLIQRVRGLAAPAGEIPIVILTRGERTPELYGRAVELGADDFLARPVLRAQVLGSILECMESRDAALPEDLAPMGSAGPSGDAPGGALEELPLPELLLRLREEGATGVLFLQHFEGLAVQLRNGSPILLASSQGAETFAEFLMRTKRIAGHEHDALLERARTAGESEPQAAVSIGALTKDEVRAALADRSSEPLLEAFSWTSGSWRFERGKRLKAGHELAYGAAHVLGRGVLQWTPSQSIRAMLDRRGALYLAAAHRPLCRLEDLAPQPCDAALLASWTGEQTVAEVLESGAVGERELYALMAAGLVETDTQAPLELSQLAEVEPVDGVGASVVSDAQPAPEASDDHAARADAAALETPPRPAAAPEGPTREPTRPETTPSTLDTGDLARGADAATASPAAEAPTDAERAKDAERHFVEGDGHLAARRYADAVASFGMAAHLDPGQGEYLAHLGYAMHLQSPKDELVRKEALEHIARGIKLASEQWKPLLYLGRVFIDSGEHANARKVLTSALRRHRECEPLLAELKRLDRIESEPQQTGLLSRLKRWIGR